jgi:pimeloyl-ACP methyl ester carboxylesterase
LGEGWAINYPVNTSTTLVLLPGMDGTGELFKPFLDAMGQRYRVKVVDYPRSGALGYAELEAAMRMSLPFDGPFVLLGESFSGPVAISIAATHPPGLKGLVLSCTFARNPRPRLGALRFLIGALPTGAIAVRCASVALLGSYSTSRLRRAFLEAIGKVTPDALRARLRAVVSVDVTRELAAIDVPVLYLRAMHDHVVPTGASEFIKSIKPEARVVDVDAPHFLLQAAPGKAAGLVAEFVDGLVVCESSN